MNGPNASDNKLLLTSETLALFIEMRQGLRKLTIHHKKDKEGYCADFETDVFILHDHIRTKLTNFIGEDPLEADFEPNFWYKGMEGTNTATEAPSDICEEGSYKVADYLVRNQKFIVKVRERLRVVADDPVAPPEPDDWEEEEEEEEEPGYESD